MNTFIATYYCYNLFNTRLYILVTQLIYILTQHVEALYVSIVECNDDE